MSKLDRDGEEGYADWLRRERQVAPEGWGIACSAVPAPTAPCPQCHEEAARNHHQRALAGTETKVTYLPPRRP